MDQGLDERVDLGMAERHASARMRRALDDRLAAAVARSAIDSGELDRPEVLEACVPGLYADVAGGVVVGG